MQMAEVLLEQVLVMMLLAAVGVVLGKRGWVKGDQTHALSNILLYAVTPCLIVNAFNRTFEPQGFARFGAALLLAALANMLFTLLSTFWIYRDKRNSNRAVERFASDFSNAGYIGIPLVQATFGTDGVFLLTAYIAVFNVMFWTQGAADMQDGWHGISLKRAICTPGVLGVMAGLLLYICPFTLPDILGSAVSYVAGMNTPLSMIVVGLLIADLSPRAFLTEKPLYRVACVRLILYPLILLGVLFALHALRLLPGGTDVALVTMIAASAPCAAGTTMMALRYQKDAPYAGRIVALSTLCCVVTVPLMAALSSWALLSV